MGKSICIRRVVVCLASLLFVFVQSLAARQTDSRRAAAAADAAEPEAAGQRVSSRQVVPALPVPRLVKFSGAVKDPAGQPRTGTVGLTFSIYAEQEGGATLWMETHNVELDEQGRYAVLLGSRQSEGMPLELFATGEPRWLGVKVELPGEIEQARVLLVSVPYALKASDSDTLGGKPASAYALALEDATDTRRTTGQPATVVTPRQNIRAGVVGNDITANYLPVFIGDFGAIGNSVMIQIGGNIGVGQVPVQTLDVNGGIRGTGMATGLRSMAPDTVNAGSLLLRGSTALDVHSPGNANNLALGQGVLFTKTSIFANSLEWLTVDGTTGNVGVGTTTPGQKLEVAGNLLLSGAGNAIIFSDGTIQNTAAGAVGGTGGTITGVTSGAGLKGGGSSGVVMLSIDPVVVPQLLATSNAFTGSITASSFTGSGAGLSNVNATALGGLPPSGFAQLAASSNTFTGSITASSLQAPTFSNTTNPTLLNSTFGLAALSPNSLGPANSAFGYSALGANTSGGYNSAFGAGALRNNTLGGGNSAFGNAALQSLVSGNSNIAIGAGAGTGLTGAESNNIYIAHAGVAGESNTIRIGDPTVHTATFLAGNVTIGAPTGNGLIFPDGTKQTTAATGGITAVNTPAGGGLMGGVTSGAANLRLLNTCATGQLLKWSGTVWGCADDNTATGTGGGTVTSISAGTGISSTSNPLTVSGTLSIDPAVVPELGANNTFTGNNTFNSLALPNTSSASVGVIAVGGTPFLHNYPGSKGNTFAGGAGNLQRQHRLRPRRAR